MFDAVLRVQRRVPGTTHTQSGDLGWWILGPASARPGPQILPLSAFAEHFIVNSANFWLLLRRNPSAIDSLNLEPFPGTPGGNLVRPLPLENKLLAPYLSIPAGQVGGLTGINPWIAAMMESRGFPTTAGSRVRPNFWGELIGVVALIQGLSDTASAVGGDLVIQQTVPALTPSTGMGLMLASAFRWWQQRRHPPLATQVPGPVFIATGVQQVDPNPLGGWIPPDPGPLFRNNVMVPMGAGSAYIPKWADPAAGQDWDTGLHQLSRAVTSMYHMGYSLTQAERLLVVTRLEQWSTRTCEGEYGNCQGGPTASPWVGAPQETTRFEVPFKCKDEPNLTDSAAVSQAHQVPDLLGAVLAILQGGCLDLSVPAAVRSRADAILGNCLIALATLYRHDDPPGVGPPIAGWIRMDPGYVEPTSNPTGPNLPKYRQPDLDGTYAAIALLIRLSGRSGYANVVGDLSNPAFAPLIGLDSYLHVFGPRIPSLLAANPWGATYVPG